MIEKEIVEVFVQVQKPEYYDRLILLIGAKFAEIVKVGETIEDDLKSGKIARVSASPGSSGLVRRKREEVATIYLIRGKKSPQKLIASSRPLQASAKVSPSLSSTIQSFWQLPCCPPLIQILKFCHIKIDPQIPKIFPPYTQITPKLIKFLILPECRSQLR